MKKHLFSRRIIATVSMLLLAMLIAACSSPETPAVEVEAEPTPTRAEIPTAAAADAEGEEEEMAEEEEMEEAEPTEEPMEEEMAEEEEMEEAEPTEEPMEEEMAEEEPTAEPMEEEMADVPQGGTVVLLGHQEVAGLSPNDTGPSVQFVMIANIHNNLVRMDQNLRIVPTLAESYEISDDGLTYTFNLRQGVLFHDGHEFTSEDVKYSMEFYGDAETGSTLASEYSSVESVETPDDYTVVVNLSEPNAPFLTVTATNFVVPAHYHSEVGEEVYRTAPIGTGPFMLQEWRPAEFTELVAFDDHF